MPPTSRLPSGLHLDLGNERLWRGAQAVTLRPKTFAVLCCLAQRPGQLVTQAELRRAVWPETAVGEGGLAVCIRELRRALDDSANSPRLIETVHRRGYRLIGRVTVTAALPNAPRLAPSGPSPAQHVSRSGTGSDHPVGRGADLERLRGWLTTSRGGTRQVVFVTGEAGVGKTTLVDAFIEEVKGQAGLLVSRGECVEQYGTGEAYRPVLEALGRLCREPAGQQVIDVLARRAPTWLVHMPWLVGTSDLEGLQHQTLGATRERMLREMAEATETLAAERPLVLVLEDLHWSDRSTLDLLACLARRREPAQLLLVGTYRPAEVDVVGSPLPALRQELGAHGQCSELPLTFLSEASVREYLARRFPAGTIPGGLSRLLHERTEGNPLFLVNLLEYWLAEGRLVCEAGALALRARRDELVIGVPETLRQMIERWVDHLGREQQLVLEVGSAAGLEFSAASVAEGLGRDVWEVDERCGRLARRGQLLRATDEKSWPDGTVAGGYAFVHALYQETLYLRLTPARRVRLHRLIGERQEAAYGARTSEVAAQLAVHFERGRESRKAIAYLQQAAEGAVRRCANAEAIDHLAKGLALLEALGDAPDRTRLELDLLSASAPVLTATKGYGAPEVERAYARALTLCERLEDDSQMFAVLRGLVAFHQQQGGLLAARRLARRLIALAQRAADPSLLLRAYQAHGTTLFYIGEPQAARRNLDRGLAIYGRGERDARVVRSGLSTAVVCLGHAAWALWLLGHPDQALARSREALALAQELAHPHSIVYALHFCGVIHQFRGEVDAARERAEAVVALATEQGFAFWRAYGAIMQGWALAVQDKRKEGLDLMRQHLVSLRATGAELGRTYFLALVGEACAKGRRTETGLRAIAEALAPIDETGERFYEAELHRLRGELLRRGAVDSRASGKQRLMSAEESLRCALHVARRQRAKSLELRAATSLSQLWQRRGKRDAARRLLSEIYAGFTEGLDTRDLRAARKLLGG